MKEIKRESYNELISRGYSVDVGIINHVESTKSGKQRKQLEIDFVCNEGNKRYYIQPAFSIPDAKKMTQEQKSLTKIPDFFKKL